MADNWSVAQTVTVLGVDDAVADDNQTSELSVLSSSSDSKYHGLSDNLSVLTADNDTVGFSVSQSTAVVSENGSVTDSIGVVLTSEPTAAVTLSVTDNDTSEVSYSPSSLVFGSGNWSVSQVITLTGVDDNVSDDNPDDVADAELEQQ